MPGLAEIIGAVVKALWEPLLKWWTTYQQGRTAQQKDDAVATAKAQQELDDATAKAREDARRLGVGDDGWLRRGGPPQT